MQASFSRAVTSRGQGGATRTASLLVICEQVANFPPQPVITADQAMVRHRPVIYFQITDLRKAATTCRQLPAGNEQHRDVRCVT